MGNREIGPAWAQSSIWKWFRREQSTKSEFRDVFTCEICSTTFDLEMRLDSGVYPVPDDPEMVAMIVNNALHILRDHLLDHLLDHVLKDRVAYQEGDW